MCVTDRYDINLAVKVALYPNTTNQPIHFNDREDTFWKHFGKRRKCWLTSIFSLSQDAFYPHQRLNLFVMENLGMHFFFKFWHVQKFVHLE